MSGYSSKRTEGNDMKVLKPYSVSFTFTSYLIKKKFKKQLQCKMVMVLKLGDMFSMDFSQALIQCPHASVTLKVPLSSSLLAVK